jgi:hypothetical protein
MEKNISSVSVTAYTPIIFDEEKLFEQSIVRRRFSLTFDFDIDFKFFAILPALNINLHSKHIEIEWLCFALYIGFFKRIFA